MKNFGIGMPGEPLMAEKGEWAFGVMLAWGSDIRGVCIILGKRMVIIGAWEDGA